MGNFTKVLKICDLGDLGFLGYPFTWCNKGGKESHILECLDHCLANSQWCALFPNYSTRHDHASYSDHYPIWLETNGLKQSRRGHKPFRFEAIGWVRLNVQPLSNKSGLNGVKRALWRM